MVQNLHLQCTFNNFKLSVHIPPPLKSPNQQSEYSWISLVGQSRMPRQRSASHGLPLWCPTVPSGLLTVFIQSEMVRRRQRQIQSQQQLGGIAKTALHKCRGTSSLDVNYVCPKHLWSSATLFSSYTTQEKNLKRNCPSLVFSSIPFFYVLCSLSSCSQKKIQIWICYLERFGPEWSPAESSPNWVEKPLWQYSTSVWCPTSWSSSLPPPLSFLSTSLS